MQGGGQSRVHPELKELVAEASRSLARLDADRLEELALSCQQLIRELAPEDSRGRVRLALQSRDAAGEMAVFARVLDASRANLNVMNRLRELRRSRLEYGAQRGTAARDWARTESGYGDD
jgi:hypothetical protein